MNLLRNVSNLRTSSEGWLNLGNELLKFFRNASLVVTVISGGKHAHVEIQDRECSWEKFTNYVGPPVGIEPTPVSC